MAADARKKHRIISMASPLILIGPKLSPQSNLGKENTEDEIVMASEVFSLLMDLGKLSCERYSIFYQLRLSLSHVTHATLLSLCVSKELPRQPKCNSVLADVDENSPINNLFDPDEHGFRINKKQLLCLGASVFDHRYYIKKLH